MFTLLVILVLLAALGILGAVIKGLLWLTAIAALVFVAVAVYGYFKFRAWSSDVA